MTNISEAVRLLLSELSAKMNHEEALPDPEVSLLQSYLDDSQIPEQVVVNNIEHLINLPGFPAHKRDEIIGLLKRE